MAAVSKIDSNVVGLRYAEEDSYKTVSGDEIWQPLDPNSYSDFGGQITTLARDPINDGRQRKKGVVTDLDASGGFNQDLTQDNLQDLLQGFFFANLRTKDELAIADVNTTLDDFQPTAGGDGYVASDLLFAKDFDDAANNGLHVVTGSPSATSVPVTSNLVTASTQTGTISRVGFQFTGGDCDVDAAGTWPAITTATKDLTQLGLIVGEWVFLGGDLTVEKFANAVNNGFARVRSIAANRVEFDITQNTMVTENTSTETIRIFFGRVLKNETGSSIVRRTYQLERTLGAPDDAQPAQIQAEYVVGAVPNQAVFNFSTADKLNVDLSFQGATTETIDGPTSLKAGTRPTLTEGDAFNTSSDVTRIKLAQVVTGDANPASLFDFLTDLTLTLNNNVSPNKAVGTLGAFDVTAGTFQVSANATAYFASEAALAAVRNNVDANLHVHNVKNNQGITFDLVLLALADARPNVEKDNPITLPIVMEAATGAKNNANMDHTFMMVFWDYLPNAADL